MFVCICNAIRESDLRGVGDAGTRCAKAAYNQLGHRPKCGQCLSVANTILNGDTAVRPDSDR